MCSNLYPLHKPLMPGWQIFTLLLVLQSQCLVIRKYENFIEKYVGYSVSVCHNSLEVQYKSGNVHNIAISLSHYSRCIKQGWRRCLKRQTHSSHSLIPQRIYKVCYKGIFFLEKELHMKYHIETFPYYQFNLTFTQFELKRSWSGCSLHFVMVSIFSGK